MLSPDYTPNQHLGFMGLAGEVPGQQKGTDVGMGVAQSQRPPNVGPRIWGLVGLTRFGLWLSLTGGRQFTLYAISQRSGTSAER